MTTSDDDNFRSVQQLTTAVLTEVANSERRQQPFADNGISTRQRFRLGRKLRRMQTEPLRFLDLRHDVTVRDIKQLT